MAPKAQEVMEAAGVDAAVECAAGASERAFLVEEDDGAKGNRDPPTLVARRVALGVGLALLLAGAAVVARWSRSTSQESGTTAVPAEFWQQEQCFQQLSAKYPEDLLEIGNGADVDQDAASNWLASASAAGDALEDTQAGPRTLDPHMSAEAQEALSQMLHIKDPKEARTFVQKAMARAVNDTLEQRRHLKAHLQSQPPPTTLSPKQAAKAAACAFDIMGILTTIASLGSNINDVAQTCQHVSKVDKLKIGRLEAAVHTQVCTINIAKVVKQLVGLGTKLSIAVNRCAITAQTNLNVTCAASVLGMITAATGTVVNGALLHRTCHSPMAASAYTASNAGNNKFLDDLIKDGSYKPDEAIAEVELPGGPPSTRRLAETMDGAGAGVEALASPRRLMFGGGKESLMTQCVTSVMSSMWTLAGAALAINSATTSCPPRDLFTQSLKRNSGLRYRIPEAMCVGDVSTILLGFLLSMQAIENSLITCTDTLNLDWLCAEGITGFLSAMAGIASTGSGLFLSCDQKTREFMAKAAAKQRAAAEAKAAAAGAAAGPPADDVVVELSPRRLSEAGIDDVEDLKARFKSPEEAFRSIGFDLEDKSAPYHEHAKLVNAEAEREADAMLARVLSAAGPVDPSVPKACGGA